jgi:acetylornithine deacetylase
MMEQSQKKVLKTIKKKHDEILNFLRQLIKIPSITQSGLPERKIQQLIGAKLTEIGCSVDMWEPKLEELKTHPAYVPVQKNFHNRPIVVGKFKGGSRGGRSIILNGHADVVSPEPYAAWKYDPWSATINGNRVFGRGATDMKGGITAMIIAFESILESGIELGGDVMIESVLDEEIGGNGTLACIMRGYRADGAIITEPTNLELHPAHRGGRFFNIRVEGKSAHVGVKFEGVSALEKAIKILNALGDFEEYRKREKTHFLFERYPLQVPLNIGVINGGEWPCTVPKEVLLEGTVECLPGESIKEVSRDLENYIRKVAESDWWMRKNKPSIEWPGLWIESSEIDFDHPLAMMMGESIRELTGKEPVVAGFPGGCDMRLLVRYAATPTIIFGPGSLKEAHSANESLRINDLIRSIEIIALFLLKWCC